MKRMQTGWNALKLIYLQQTEGINMSFWKTIPKQVFSCKFSNLPQIKDKLLLILSNERVLWFEILLQALSVFAFQ